MGKSVSGKFEAEPHEIAWQEALNNADSEPNGNGKYWLTKDGLFAKVRYHSDVSGPPSSSEAEVAANNRVFAKRNHAIRLHLEDGRSIIEYWTPMSEDQESAILQNVTRSEMHIEAHNPYGPNYNKSLYYPSYEEIYNAFDNGNRATQGEDVSVRDVYYKEEDRGIIKLFS